MEENLKQSLSKAQNEIEAADSLEVLRKNKSILSW